MNKCLILALVLVFLLLYTGASRSDEVKALEIRGPVATADFEWNSQNFPGFYYDLNNNIGTELLKTTITEGNKLQEPTGIAYTTTAQKKDFDFADWGYYNVIGFLGDKYLAGYVMDAWFPGENQIMFRESTDENSLSDEQLQKILIDDDTEMTVTSGTPLKMEEGYELAIKSLDIDVNKVYLELSKDGQVVDSKVISPSKYGATMADKTYYYKKNVGNQAALVIIAVHFKNAFRGAGQNLATVDGIWQISDNATEVGVDTEYDKMRVSSVDATNGVITMDNKDNTIALSKNREIPLMGNIGIKVADVDELRYYIFKNETEFGTYEVHGQVATGDFEWYPQNFAGFYYDIDDDLGTETIRTTITEGNKLQEPSGLTYYTTAQKKGFGYNGWGYYNIIGFLGKRYFTGYISGGPSGTSSEILEEAGVTNLLEFEELAEILLDEGNEKVLDLGKTVDLMNGYALKPTVGTDNRGLLVELQKDGKTIDRKAVSLPGTYVYAAKVGDADGMPVIAAHFQEPIFLNSKSYCKVDGLWQISENTIKVGIETSYDKMRIASVDPASGSIILDNADNSLTLYKNMETSILGDIKIKTADADELRYYIFKNAGISADEGSL